MRDDGSCQQFELYAAEKHVPVGKVFATEVEAQAFVNDMRELPWWDLMFTTVQHVIVRARTSNRHGSVGGFNQWNGVGEVELAPQHMNALLLIHEVAHVCAAARYGSHAHDPWYARTYLELVALYLPKSYTALVEGFNREGVDHQVEGSGGGIAL